MLSGAKREADEASALDPPINSQRPKKTQHAWPNQEMKARKAFLVNQIQSEEWLNQTTNELCGCFYFPGKVRVRFVGKIQRETPRYASLPFGSYVR
jgi:TorA maturation chaperone TorD